MIRNARFGVAFLIAVLVFASVRSAFSLEPFLMGISNKHISTAYLFLGKEQNYFAEEGIDLKLVFIPVSVAPTALVAQQIDGMEFASTGIQAGTRGVPLKAVFLQSRMPGWYLMSNPSITDMRQVSGKAVSVGTLGSGAHNLTVEILKKIGVDPKSVVFMGGRGGSDVRLQMLMNGTVQVANLLPPYTYIAERQGFRQLIFYGDYAELAQFGLIVHDANLKNKRPFLKRIVRAFLKSHLYALQNPKATEGWVAKNLNMSAEDAQKTVDVLRKISTANGTATDNAIQNTLDEAVKSRGFKTETLVDYSILREIHEEKGSK
ncbi:MAG: NitT/TauT family transport system substrate-binding protein [Candidatus Binatota bacterium]|nr:NitT/TauT family transport system substrate-binding protein [Candidatus Binatota bacterium]